MAEFGNPAHLTITMRGCWLAGLARPACEAFSSGPRGTPQLVGQMRASSARAMNEENSNTQAALYIWTFLVDESSSGM